MINVEKTFDSEEAALGFVINGVMPEATARKICSQEPEEALTLQAKLTELQDSLTEGELNRLRWLSRQLGAQPIDKTVFIEYVKGKAKVSRGDAMGYRYSPGIGSTNGRHSSWATVSSFHD